MALNNDRMLESLRRVVKQCQKEEQKEKEEISTEFSSPRQATGKHLKTDDAFFEKLSNAGKNIDPNYLTPSPLTEHSSSSCLSNESGGCGIDLEELKKDAFSDNVRFAAQNSHRKDEVDVESLLNAEKARIDLKCKVLKGNEKLLDYAPFLQIIRIIVVIYHNKNRTLPQKLCVDLQKYIYGMRTKRPRRNIGEKFHRDNRLMFVDSTAYIREDMQKIFALQDLRERWTSFLNKFYEELYEGRGESPIREITDVHVQKDMYHQIRLHIGLKLNWYIFYGYGRTGNPEAVITVLDDNDNYDFDDDMSTSNSSVKSVSSQLTFHPSLKFINFISPEEIAEDIKVLLANRRRTSDSYQNKRKQVDEKGSKKKRQKKLVATPIKSSSSTKSTITTVGSKSMQDNFLKFLHSIGKQQAMQLLHTASSSIEDIEDEEPEQEQEEQEEEEEEEEEMEEED